MVGTVFERPKLEYSSSAIRCGPTSSLQRAASKPRSLEPLKLKLITITRNEHEEFSALLPAQCLVVTEVSTGAR